MSNFGNYYNPQEVEADAGFEKLPDGNYTAIISESEIVEKPENQHVMIKVQFEIIEGNLKGRKIYNNYNIVHKNETAANIGRSQLKKLCEVCGKPNATDANELHNIPVVISVGTQKKDDRYNEIRDVKKVGSETQNSGVPSKKPSWAGN